MEHDGLAKNLRKTPGHIDSQRKNGDYTRMLVMLKKQQVQRNVAGSYYRSKQHVQQPSYRAGKFNYFLSNNATVESRMLHQHLT